MDPRLERQLMMTRRSLFGAAGVGLGSIALATMMAEDGLSSQANSGPSKPNVSGGLPDLPHFPARAKRVIWMLQSGAPSQVDLFDYKPGLAKMLGQELPASVQMGQRVTSMTAGQAKKQILPSIAEFKQRGKSGMWISDFLPYTAGIADELCLLKAMHTEAINHAPAVTHLMTGGQQPGRPSMGAWLSYGLGSANSDLPTFCVMTSRDREGTCGQLFFDYYWGSGFLPSSHQGVKFRGGGDPVLYLSNPDGVAAPVRRGQLDDLARLNSMRFDAVGDPEISTRIAQYEMAYRMQSSVPSLIDFSTEPEHILKMYGPDVHRRGSYASNCLLARRLAERDVRFIQLFHAGWDQHQNLPTQLINQCRDTDQASAALVMDLKQRGLLDDTLVIWGGEFGRTVFCQGNIGAADKKYGRDHHPRNFAIWMAGGGMKSGLTYGETDDFSYSGVKDKVHIHDLQATVLNQLGIDHKRLTFKFQGRHFRLTDVAGEVVKDVLA
ncbi:MAG: DUF1501 domain-containing protein [Planctomycetia bacterium]|nr:DUF1501 domain-containing protein [Planctomycetia bacterium]